MVLFLEAVGALVIMTLLGIGLHVSIKKINENESKDQE